MKRMRTILAVALTLAAVCGSAFAADAKEPAKPDARPPIIKGVVVDGKGKPVRNAQVVGVTYMIGKSGWDSMPGSTKASVDSTGHFTFKPKAKSDVGYYVVVATADGFACGSASFRAEDPKREDELKITLKPGYTLKGKVVDENGKPLSGAKVAVEGCYGYGSGGPGDNIPGNVAGILESISGKDGKFTISRLLKPSNYQQFYVSLSASKKGRAMVQKSFNVHDSTDEISGGVTIKQPVECSAQGVLYLPGKVGTAPAGVSIAALVPSQYGWQPRMCTTDKNGKFHLDALPPGKTTIVLGPTGYKMDKDGKRVRADEQPWVLAAVVTDLKPKQLANLQLVAEPGAVIKGRVVTKKGDVAKQAALVINDRCSPKGGLEREWHTIVADDKGEFTTRVASGDVGVAVQRWQNNWFNSDEMPKVELKVADGEDKADIALTIDPAEQQASRIDYQKSSKEIPNDFELKPGTYELAWDAGVDCSDAAQSYSMMDDAKIKSTLKGAPKLASTKAKYFACRFDGSGDDGCLVVILDESKGTGKGYDTAYVDVDRNWDLSDDKPITFATPKSYRQIYTDEFSMPLRQREDGGKVSERAVQARLTIYGDGSNYIQATVTRKGAWKGTVDSSKGKIECAVIDTSCNGISGEAEQFKDDGNPSNEGDYIFFDTNGAGGVIPYPYGSHGAMLYRVTKVGSKFYNITVNNLGDKVTIAPYTGEMGTLLVRGTNIQGLKASADSLAATSTCGNYSVQNCGGKEVSLPVGKYHVNSCALIVKSADSRKLSMGCQLNSAVDVKPNAKSTVDIGGKLSMAIDPDQKVLTWTPGTNTLTWVITLGYNVTLNSIGDRNNSSNTPIVKFFNNKGKLVYTAKTNYT